VTIIYRRKEERVDLCGRTRGSTFKIEGGR
jgi:hypothetical protein